jgi:hypothetical protein
MDFARPVVELHAPRLMSDPRFSVVGEDPRKWGYIIFGNDQARIIVSVHHSGRDVSIRRRTPMREAVDFATPVDVFASLERERPTWAGKFEDALEYLDRNLDQVLQITESERAWDAFLSDAMGILEATMGN